MRLRTLTVLAVLLALPSGAGAGEIPRHQPRLTDPSGYADPDAEPPRPPRQKKKRKNAKPVEPPPVQEEARETYEAPPPPHSRPEPAAEAEPAPRRRPPPAPEDDEEPTTTRESRESSRRSRDDAAELRDDYEEDRRSRRGRRTAEEDLAEPEARERSLAGIDEPGTGVAAELIAGPLFLSTPMGVDTRFFGGLSASVHLGRRLFAAENPLLHDNLFFELSWLYSSSGEGTDLVKVGSSFHYLSGDFLFGYPLKPALFYLKFGPAMTIMPVQYDVQGTLTTFTGVKAGVVYGLGARASLYTNEKLGVAGRIELVRYRRGYLDDTLLAFGMGATF